MKTGYGPLECLRRKEVRRMLRYSPVLITDPLRPFYTSYRKVPRYIIKRDTRYNQALPGASRPLQVPWIPFYYVPRYTSVRSIKRPLGWVFTTSQCIRRHWAAFCLNRTKWGLYLSIASKEKLQDTILTRQNFFSECLERQVSQKTILIWKSWKISENKW